MCLCHGLELSLSPVATPDTTPSQRLKTPHPLLQVLSLFSPSYLPLEPTFISLSLSQASHTSLLRRVGEDSTDTSLLSPLLWLLISQKLLNISCLDQTSATAILTLVLHCLQQVDRCDTLAVQASLDSVSLSLALPEVQSAVDEEWVSSIVPLVTGLLEGDSEWVCGGHVHCQSLTLCLQHQMC